MNVNLARLKTLTEKLNDRDHDIKDSEELFRLSFENSLIGMAIVDKDGTWLKVNSRLESILGYKSIDLVGRVTFQDITHPNDLKKDVDLVNECLSGLRNDYVITKRYIRATGEIVSVVLGVSAVKDKDGGVKFFLSQILPSQILEIIYTSDELSR